MANLAFFKKALAFFLLSHLLTTLCKFELLFVLRAKLTPLSP